MRVQWFRRCLGALQAFAEKWGLTYPLLSDSSREMVK
jgi:peroxiredoxin